MQVHFNRIPPYYPLLPPPEARLAEDLLGSSSRHYSSRLKGGMSLRELAARLDMSAPGVGFSVERGEAIARENAYELTR
jgi:hypothetical protein